MFLHYIQRFCVIPGKINIPLVKNTECLLWFTTTINYKVEIKKGLFSMGGPITFRDQSFTLSENSDNETIIGALDATQPDNKPLTFTIINNIDSDGDGNSAFSIDGTNLLV